MSQSTSKFRLGVKTRLLQLFLVLLSACTAAGLAACQKETAAPEKSTAQVLEGRWELVQTAGGISGHTQPADPTRKQELIFGADGQVQFVVNGTTTSTTSYTLAQAIAHTSQKNETFLNYGAPASASRQYIAELSATTLILNDDNPDGISATYQRIPLLWCGTTTTPSSTSLSGTWKLVSRMAYLPAPASTPNEKVIFTGNGFSFYANNVLAASGTYTSATVTTCSSTPVPGLHFTASQGSWNSREATYTITGNKLVLDYGGPCDAPVDTYELVP